MSYYIECYFISHNSYYVIFSTHSAVVALVGDGWKTIEIMAPN